MRCVSEALSANTHTLITLASPHIGFWGTEAMNKYLPFLPFPIEKFALDDGYRIMETPLLQKTFSPANLFHDPKHEQWHLENNLFLPVCNNLIQHERQLLFKENFSKLENAVFLVGNMTEENTDFEGGIEPWNTGILEFWNPKAPEKILPFEESPIYVNDTFGLKLLDEAGKLHRIAVQNITHNMWVLDYNVWDEYVYPWLV